MPRRCWPCVAAFLFIVVLGLGTGRAVPLAYVLRFADTLPRQDPSHQAVFAVLPENAPEAPAVSANSWLMHNGWKQIWPLRLLGAGPPLFFAGPPTQRYLRLSADDNYYIWTRQSTPAVDIQQPCTLSCCHYSDLLLMSALSLI